MRDERYDVVKGMAIILMVVGHAGCARFPHDFINLFHMPAFFILTGRFLRSATTGQDVRLFFRKKIARLWWPFFFWSALFVLLHNVFLSHWHMGVSLVVREGPLWCLLYTAFGLAVPLAVHAAYVSVRRAIHIWRETRCASAS